jgi:hypothetical protein
MFRLPRRLQLRQPTLQKIRAKLLQTKLVGIFRCRTTSEYLTLHLALEHQAAAAAMEAEHVAKAQAEDLAHQEGE